MADMPPTSNASFARGVTGPLPTSERIRCDGCAREFTALGTRPQMPFWCYSCQNDRVQAGKLQPNRYLEAMRADQLLIEAEERIGYWSEEAAGKQTIRLQGVNGDYSGTVWESATSLRVGRLNSLEIVLDDNSVSRRHALVYRNLDEQIWRLRDLGSTNGTFLNRRRLGASEEVLRPRDIVQFGKVAVLVAVIGDAETQWLAHDHANIKLNSLPFDVSERKLRLYLCACLRIMGYDPRSVDAMANAERLADTLSRKMVGADAICEFVARTQFDITKGFDYFFGYIRPSVELAAMVHHIFGNPFRPFPAPASWPATVTALAEALHNGEECHYALADALMETGQLKFAEHFKQTWHPKGCWAMDVILGKE